MNKKTLLTYKIIFLLILTTTLNCKKINPDYRDTYTGDWSFATYRTVFASGSPRIYNYDTVTYQGEIIYGELDNEILIKYTPNNPIVLSVEESGDLFGFPSLYSHGEFINSDEIDLFLRWGGLGSGTKHKILGVKK